uniref:Protein CHROMATIN REMODELING 20-like isoform X2 n=1 Tax=Rhizophora mucronata TaxID=61149 RepID=A0A2P2MV39_RHIMU
MEEKHEVDVGSASGDSFTGDSDDDEPSISGEDDTVHHEEPLTEREIEELIAEFLEVESKAAEAQEALEKESLAKVESEVRDELAQTLTGDDLEAAVEEEMANFSEEWEGVLDELETNSTHLLEQLDGAGIELPSLYKWIESQAQNCCFTDAWKRRAHWVGCRMTSDITQSVADAEKYLQTHRPVRRRHGKLLEEGASGFLKKKLMINDDKEALAENGDVDWASLKNLFSSSASKDAISFGSKYWASVYLANTPQEAAMMGLKFPGVNEIEEIEDIEGNPSDPFVADAIENEKELVLSEEQKNNYRKVKEEDDAKIDHKLQLRLKQRRRQRRCKQKELSSVDLSIRSNVDDALDKSERTYADEVGYQNLKQEMSDSYENCNNLNKEEAMSNGNPVLSESLLTDVTVPKRSKRLNESLESNIDGKKARTIVIDSDEETDDVRDKSLRNGIAVEDHSTVEEVIRDPSASCHLSEGWNEEFHCTSCDKFVTNVHSHPYLKVIVCQDCKCLIEEKMRLKVQNLIIFM